MLGAVSAQMVFDQDVMKRSRLIMDKSYSWPWAVPEVSTKKRQSQQGEGGCLSCGSDDGLPQGGVGRDFVARGLRD